MKIIIYALGELFNLKKELIDWEVVIGVSDKEKKEDLYLSGMVPNGIRFISSDQIKEVDYDYIVVFSNKLFDSIRIFLIFEMGLDGDKIIPWTVYHDKYTWSPYDFRTVFKRYNIKNVYEAGNNSWFDRLINTEAVSYDNDGIAIYSCNHRDSEIYKTSVDKENQLTYDALVILEKDFMNLESLDVNTPIIIVILRQSFSSYNRRKEIINELGGDFYIDHYATTSTNLMILYRKSGRSTRIYVAKNFSFHCMKDTLYTPICLGGYKCDGELTETEGNNISYLNSKINESTAYYWIWKNAKEDIVGLNHYRRYFLPYEHSPRYYPLSNIDIEKVLEDYQGIVAQMYYNYLEPIGVSQRRSVDSQAYDMAYSLLEDSIKKHQPDYYKAFCNVLEGYAFYPCNLFITRKEIFDEYCSWLFSFLIPAAETLDVSNYDPYSKRVMAFLSERMLTVWLLKQNLRIKELPYWVVKS